MTLPAPSTHPRNPIFRDLGGGLILRRASETDADRLAAYNGVQLLGDPGMEFDSAVAEWTRELMSGNHPVFKPDDFTIVEDSRTGEIVSSLCLISQTWSYDGIPVKAGQPELVSTHPDYRRKGLIRHQFDAIHEWSAERGELMQGIAGIPWFYRQFGYEMGLEMGGGRQATRDRIPKLKEGESEPFLLRPATEADLPFITLRYEEGNLRYRVAAVRNEAMWRLELQGRHSLMNRRDIRIITSLEGDAVGFLVHSPEIWNEEALVTSFELIPGISYRAVLPSVLRSLEQTGKTLSESQNKSFMRLAFEMGGAHPVYQAAPDWLPETRRPYAWYVRVPDLPAFLRRITPALERRLSDSPMAGFTGEIKVHSYRKGFRMTWEAGRLTGVEPWKLALCNDGDAAFPGETFLHLLFGHRSLEELRYAFADCSARGDAEVLLDALFPKQASCVWPCQ